MATDFVVRRYALEGSEWDENWCDDCAEHIGEVTDRARNGDPTWIKTEDGGEWYWIEDKEDPEDRCHVCGKSAEDHEEDEPDEGDYAIDSGNGVSIIGERFLGYYSEPRAFVKQHMREENYYPNVWTLSDHGNWHLVTDLED